MMDSQAPQTASDFRFLDSEADRQTLINDIRRVRQNVTQLIEALPADKIYVPRYHGWTPAAMLAHLHLTDNLSLMALKLALAGLPLPISSGLWDQMNDAASRLFARRVLATTLRGIKANENRIADFILQTPVKGFSKRFYYPPINRYVTVEQALQVLFLHHWQQHLKTIEGAEGYFYEPPANPTMA
jgi:hypothetical protein